MRAITTLAVVVCCLGGDAQSQPRNTGNKAHDMFVNASDSTKRKAMETVVQSSGERGCSVVAVIFWGFDKSSRQSMWRTDCSDRRSFMVSLYPDSEGSTKVLSCAVAKALGTDCFKPAVN